MAKLMLNGKSVALDVSPDTPLLWAIREQTGLTGTKFGCGIGACGACTVLIDGHAVRSCVIPVAGVEGRSVTTIEGLSSPERLSDIQAAWIEHQVPQCGYCQSGMIIAVTSLLDRNPSPSDEEIDASITNICRCGTYERIRAAIHSLSAREDSTYG